MKTLRKALASGVLYVLGAPIGWAQAPADAVAVQLRELAAQVAQLRQELSDSKKESTDLRLQLDDLRHQLDTLRGTPPQTAVAPATPVPVMTNEQLTEEQELLSAKVDDQYQTKVESSSKNRVQLVGMALFTTSLTSGTVNNLDLPGFAEPRSPGDSNGALSATLRQTMFGLNVDGPKLMGARTRGEIRADFFGLMPTVADGVTTGLVRLRTAHLTLDWKKTSLFIGQDSPFFSPLSPSSLVQSAYPANWNSGNLWTWTPQVNVTHKFGTTDKTRFVVQYGLLDALSGELTLDEYDRSASAGERSRKPAVAVRLGAERTTQGRKASAGASMYYSRQNFGFDRRVDSWAATADWELPLGRWFTLSGEAYRGRAIGGLGGGVGRTVLMSGPATLLSTRIRPVDSAGGWAQLKLKPTQRWEVNMAYGGDIPLRVSRSFPAAYTSGEDYKPYRNVSGSANIIYQPRNNLLFSIEYRRLWTTPFDESRSRAHHIGLGAGILF